MSEEQAEVKTEEVEVSTELKNIIEALVFASDEPLTVRFIRSIMDDVNKDIPPAEHFIVNAEIIRKAVGDLNRGYGRMGSGFRIIEVAGGFIHATQEQFASWVGKLAKERARRRLSPTAVETLAIIAYKQPIAKGEVEFIRGVNVDYIINALLEKDLIHITGRATTPGRPLLYGTTQKFLEHFGLNELTDLPKPREIEELIGETELEVDRRLLAEQQELEFKGDLEKKLDGNEGTKNKPQKSSKVKVPDELKAEIRAEERRQKEEQQVSGNNRTTEEGEQLSESNQQIINETAELAKVLKDETMMTEDVQPVEAAMIESEQEDLKTSVQERSETIELESQAIDRNPLKESERMIHSEDLKPVLNADEVENQVLSDQVHSSNESLTEDRELSSEHHSIENVPESLPEKAVFHSTENEPRDQAQNQQNEMGSGSASGWSKWKNKVKTFFRKLFA